jgi:hypothetical protein
MTTIILNITDESLISQIKNICSMIKGVGDVKVIKSKDITKTKGYKEAMDDIANGRICCAERAEEMFNQILG